MKIYFLMFFYVFLVGVICKATVSYKKNDVIEGYYMPWVASFIIIALPLVFIGFRTEFNDTYAYIRGFENLTVNFGELQEGFEDSKGFIWLIYQWIIKRYISTNYSVFLFITAAIQIAAVVKVYRKYSIDYCYSILLFFLSCSFLNLMGAIRQFMALSVLLFFSDWIFEDKPIRFSIVVLFASMIHVSAIIWLPIVFVVSGKAGNLKTILIALLAILAVLYLDQFTSLLTETLEGTLYEGYTDQFLNDDGSNIMHSVIAAVPILLWLLGRRLVDIQNNKLLNALINISIVGLMVNLLAHFTSGILVGRMPIYFTIFNFALLPNLFNSIFATRSKSMIKLICAAGYLAYAIYYMNAMGLTYVSSILGF